MQTITITRKDTTNNKKMSIYIKNSLTMDINSKKEFFEFISEIEYFFHRVFEQNLEKNKTKIIREIKEYIIKLSKQSTTLFSQSPIGKKIKITFSVNDITETI